MSTVSKAQQAFPSQVRLLVEDLCSFASPADHETQSLLNSVLRTVNSAWEDYLPLERDAIVDNLLALLCEACAHGSFGVGSSVRPCPASLPLAGQSLTLDPRRRHWLRRFGLR